MNKKRKTERWAIWIERVKNWKDSGLLQADFCRQHDLDAHHFSLWKRKIEQEGNQPATKLVEIPFGTMRNVALSNEQSPPNQRNKVTISVKIDSVTITLEP